jgi:hypothetical protein
MTNGQEFAFAAHAESWQFQHQMINERKKRCGPAVEIGPFES